MFNSLVITGGAGFIGSAFVHHFMRTHPQSRVLVLDLLTYASNFSYIRGFTREKRFSFVQGDIGDANLVSTLLRSHRADCIVHFAAESHVDNSINAPESFLKTNILGTYTLLEEARKYWLTDSSAPNPTHFHYTSTDEVFGSLAEDSGKFTEESNYRPNSPYSASKASADHIARAYRKTYGLNVTVSHCSNAYGPNQHKEKLIPKIINNILTEQPIPIYGDGNQIRDWMYVASTVAAIDKILSSKSKYSSFNIGANNEISNIELVKTICTLVDQKFKQSPSLFTRYPKAISAASGNSQRLIKHTADRAGHDFRYGINTSLIEQELGYSANGNFIPQLNETIDWYIN